MLLLEYVVFKSNKTLKEDLYIYITFDTSDSYLSYLINNFQSPNEHHEQEIAVSKTVCENKVAKLRNLRKLSLLYRVVLLKVIYIDYFLFVTLALFATQDTTLSK